MYVYVNMWHENVLTFLPMLMTNCGSGQNSLLIAAVIKAAQSNKRIKHH